MTPPNALTLFQHVDWSSLPIEQLAEGVTRQMIVGERVMVCRLVLAPRTVTAIHSHVHEQITLVERGSVDFFVEGQKRTAVAGEVLLFPSGIQHVEEAVAATEVDAVTLGVDE